MTKLIKRVSLFATLALLIVIPLVGCSSDGMTRLSASSKTSAPASSSSAGASAKEPYKIGFVNSFTGYMSAMGAPERDAVLALEERINADGGINGRPLKIIPYDDQSDGTQAVLIMRRLIERDNVLGIIGTSGSDFAMVQVPVAEESQVPFVTMNSSRSILVPPKKWVFKLPLSEVFYIDNMFRYMKERKWTKIALLAQGASFGTEARKYFLEKGGKQGVQIVGNETYGENDKDFGAQLTKLKGAGADVLVVYGAETAGARAVRQSREMDFRIPVLAPESLTMAAIMNNRDLREGLEGMYLVGHKPDVWQQLPDTDKQKRVNADLDALIKKSYDRSSGMWEANAHDSFTLMMEGLKRTNPDPSNVPQARQKIRDAIESIQNYVGAANVVSYSIDSHEIIVPGTGVITQIQGGKFKLIEAID